VLAKQVISDDEELDAARARCEDQAFMVWSLQAPVAQGLRLVVSGIQAAEKIERATWPGTSPSSPAAAIRPALSRRVDRPARRDGPACGVRRAARAGDHRRTDEREFLNAVQGVASGCSVRDGWMWRCWPGSSNASPSRPYR